MTKTAATFVALLVAYQAPFAIAWTPLWSICRTTVAAMTIVSHFMMSPEFDASPAPSPPPRMRTLLDSSPPKQQQQPSASSLLEQELMRTLKPPSEERPQIQLPKEAAASIKASDEDNAPIVEALLYLMNQNVRPGPLDTIVITVSDADKPNMPPLAGAKLPISRARLPTKVRLFSQNVADPNNVPLLKSAERLLVDAVVCPEGPIPCRNEEQTLRAQGVAKLVTNLPGLPEGVQVRAAASLPLQ